MPNPRTDYHPLFAAHLQGINAEVEASKREKEREREKRTKQKAGRGNFMAHLFRVNRKS